MSQQELAQQGQQGGDSSSSSNTPPVGVVNQTQPPPSNLVPVPRGTEEPPPKVEEEKAQKKVFTRSDIKRSVDIKVHFPRIYPDYEPFGFKFRLKLSGDAEERRQQYLSLSAAEITSRTSEQALDEVCDLLVELPTGFGDLQSTGQGPGPSFRSYVETAEDPDMKVFLRMVVEAADSGYWAAIAPREFRSQI